CAAGISRTLKTAEFYPSSPFAADACFRTNFDYRIKHKQNEPESRQTGAGIGEETAMRGRWSLAIAGVILILVGGISAYFTQTSAGIRIQDVRFAGAKGNTMSALLYIPPNASVQTPA